MTSYKILNSVFRTTTAFFLIGASITVPLSAVAAESNFLSAEFHAAATKAADRFKNVLRLELTETIRLPTSLRVNLVVANEAMDDVIQKDRLMSSHAAIASRENDT